MKGYMMALGFITTVTVGKAQTPDFLSYPIYKKPDLGLTYSRARSVFRIWAPTADKAVVTLYRAGEGGEPLQEIKMEKGAQGSWSSTLEGDQAGKFYAFRVQINGKWSADVPDPYAKAVGVNGKRAMVIDLGSTNPPGWAKDKRPRFDHPTDAIIYELHIRDASIAASSGILNKGKYLGLTEKGTHNPGGLATGLDHLKELGITHVHLLPCFDFNSIDESKSANSQYNWGYDPLNYNAPEGSYATNAVDGITRIKEFKQLIASLHASGLRVIMDVVYNHTALTEESSFNQLVPGYYYRHTPEGKFSNATACGNETASERPMFRKFMLESVKYWATEYHIDGFRFDLMGVHDVATMNLVSKELHTILPTILLYGEGWTAGASPLADSLRAIKKNAFRLKQIAVFSDDIRDGIKGNVFEHTDRGFVSGKPGMEGSIRFGVVAACKHPQVDYGRVNYSTAPYAAGPGNTITYCECHDNHTLWDKLAISATGRTEIERKQMQLLALSIVLTSQGIAFLHAGTEFLRSKKGVENSFQSPDSINAIDWNLKTTNKDVFAYVKGLIRMRREHPAFRMQTTKEIVSNLAFMEDLPQGIVGYRIHGTAVGDAWKEIMVLFNGTGRPQQVLVGQADWRFRIRDNQFTGSYSLKAGPAIEVAPFSCAILSAIP